ncbi:MAG TPA: HD domain-containing phosphohydrolase, partial [Blastocatellia bacterium]|nr:HD domain-containing phosphohydrolase [Blastocatellia bacterium]
MTKGFGKTYHQSGPYEENRTPRGFVIGISLAGGLALLYAVYSLVSGTFDAQSLLLGAVTVLVVSRIELRSANRTSTITLSGAFLFICFLLYGVMATVVLAGIDSAVTAFHRSEKRRLALFYGCASALSMFGTGILVDAVFGSPADLAANAVSLIAGAAILAFGFCASSTGLASYVAAVRDSRPFSTVWRESFVWAAIPGLAGIVTACLVVKLIAVISFYAFIVAVPVLAISYMTYRIYQDKVESASHHAEQMAEVHLRTMEALALAIDAKDDVSQDHVKRVQIYSAGLARLFGLSELEIEALRAAALLHDVGNLAVPDHILNKPGPLTPAEFEKMKVHATVGAQILERVGFPYPVVPVVRYHHERWDGRGYPDGLKGDQIPVTARILAVADCFDAMQQERQYRKALPREEAINVIREGGGKAFDPEVARAFLDNLADFEAEIRQQGVDRHTGKILRERRRQTKEPVIDARDSAFDQIRSAHREVLALYHIAELIGSSLDLRDIFAVICNRLESIVSYSTCVLYLFDRETTELVATFGSGRHADWFKDRRMGATEGVAGWVVAHRQAMHNCDPKLDFDALKIELRDQYRAGTVVPLMRENDVLGAFALYSTEVGVYEPDHLRLVEGVAKLFSDAVANSLDHQKTGAIALTDPLTGLPNARALRYRFEEQVEIAKRHRDSFCIVMMDLDGFKGVNDTLGHQAGDQLLREVGKFISSQMRASDLLSRYGGDEFVALLPLAPDEVPDVVWRIQRSVDRRDFGVGKAGTMS